VFFSVKDGKGKKKHQARINVNNAVYQSHHSKHTCTGETGGFTEKVDKDRRKLLSDPPLVGDRSILGVPPKAFP